MKPSTVMLASVFITALILVVIGGVTSNVLASKSADPVVPQQTVQAYQQREADYNQLIQQANQQLDTANAELAALQGQSTQADPQPTAGAALSADQASQIARQAAGPGQAILKQPDLVDFQGKTAYEVAFGKGSVYVDAQDGSVLFNGTVPQQVTADQAAQAAADYLKNQDILQVDQVTIGNAPRYRVIFKNGTLVWLDLTGQITDIQLPAPAVPSVQASTGSGSSSGSHAGTGGGGSQPSGGHEDDGHGDD